jgi:hypothetical protein
MEKKCIIDHIRQGWDMANWAEDEPALRWLDDGQQDAIPQSAARVLGAERTAVLARQAEAGLDEGILSLCLPILFCIWNPYRYNKCK